MDANFRGCFSQVQQEKLANKKLEDQTVVYIDRHNNLQKILKKKITNFRGFAAKQNKNSNSPWVKPLIYLTFYHLLTPSPLASIDNLDQRPKTKDQRRTTYRLICIRVLLNQPEIFVRLIKWKTGILQL